MRPILEEVRRWLVSTLKHSFSVEYYLYKLGIGENDTERPHDIIGVGNKFEWEVIKGFALQYRPFVDFDKYILPSLMRHRQQYHHRMWNNHDPNDPTKPVPEATIDDMKLGAVDSICSLMDDRPYQGGPHDFEQIVGVIENNPPHKVKWFWMVYSQLTRIEKPNLDLISLENIPSVGIPRGVHERMIQRVAETLFMLKHEHKYDL